MGLLDVPVDQETIKNCLMAIHSADDKTLDVIMKMVSARRKAILDMQAFENLATVYVGDYVIVKDNITPQYLQGCKCKVLKILSGDQVQVEVVDISKSPSKTRAEKHLYSKFRLNYGHFVRE
jgi:hypothetical protein